MCLMLRFTIPMFVKQNAAIEIQPAVCMEEWIGKL